MNSQEKDRPETRKLFKVVHVQAPPPPPHIKKRRNLLKGKKESWGHMHECKAMKFFRKTRLRTGLLDANPIYFEFSVGRLYHNLSHLSTINVQRE